MVLFKVSFVVFFLSICIFSFVSDDVFQLGKPRSMNDAGLEGSDSMGCARTAADRVCRWRRQLGATHRDACATSTRSRPRSANSSPLHGPSRRAVAELDGHHRDACVRYPDQIDVAGDAAAHLDDVVIALSKGADGGRAEVSDPRAHEWHKPHKVRRPLPALT